MTNDQILQLGHDLAEEGFKKYSSGYSFLSPAVLKSLVRSHAFEALHEKCKASDELNEALIFTSFASAVEEAIETKFSVHFENPVS